MQWSWVVDPLGPIGPRSRLGVDVLREAFRRSGRRPKQGYSSHSSGCACGIHALCYAKGIDPRGLDDEGFADALHLRRRYVTGFIDGWDGRDFEPDMPRGGYREGFEDGHAAWAALGAGAA